MVDAGKGAIVTMSSDFAVMAVPGAATYMAAKSAIYALTKSIALEFADKGIRANALGPGPIDTPILKTGRIEAEWRGGAPDAQRKPAGRPPRPAGGSRRRARFPAQRPVVLYDGTDRAPQMAGS